MKFQGPEAFQGFCKRSKGFQGRSLKLRDVLWDVRGYSSGYLERFKGFQGASGEFHGDSGGFSLRSVTEVFESIPGACQGITEGSEAFHRVKPFQVV